MLKIGQKVNENEISNQVFEVFQDNAFSEVKLSDYKGKWLVLIFYPSDFTFVCPTELQEMAKNYEKFKELGAEVISVSTDSVFVHKAWHDESPAIKEITYPMLADPTGNLCREFGIYIEEEGVSLRGSFVIDPDSVLKAFEVHDNSIGRSARELLRKLEAAIFVRENHGEVCPASWTPGEKTLKPGVDLVGKI
ncbi:redoxin domain-containing protein [candidate division WWE3 bacterium]|jgi:NADH-dependent peroxiredoxin subunit C|nr:redoxin domain-containing protein [candidate division WWE3 bacterium]MBT7349369.1 redoxin domain-containing protein [candidate division WWE3 bacterium]